MPNKKTNRGFWSYLFLTIITLGIYPLYYFHVLAKEVNLALTEEDGKTTTGLLGFILLSLVTAGIYSFIWWCSIASRLDHFYVRRSLVPTITCGSFIGWNTFGLLLFGLGPIIAFFKVVHAHNDVNRDYNARFIYA